MSVYCGKTANSIEMLFEMLHQVGSTNRVLHGGVQIPEGTGQIFEEIEWHSILYRADVASAMEDSWSN